jgi:nucleoporin NUP2
VKPFGSTTTPVAPPATLAALPKPFAGFTFPTSAASTSVTTPASPPKAVQPAAPAAPAVPAAPAAPAAPAVPAANGTSSSANGPRPSLATPPPESEVEYYTSLRGLNRSFLAFLQSTYDSDNLVDLSTIVPGLLSQYSKHVKEAEDRSGFAPAKALTSELANGAGPTTSTATPAPPPKPAAAPPAPPKVGSFTLLPTATSSSAPSGPGFVPSFASTSVTTSPFTFGAAAKPPSKPSAEVSKLVEDVISGREEQAPKSPPKRKAEEEPETTIAAKKPASMFSFAPSGPLHPSTPDSKSFAPSSSLESPSTMTPPAQLGKFGPGGSVPQLAFGGAKASPGTPASTSGKPSSFSFGSGSGSGDPLSFNVGQEHGPPGDAAAKPSTFSFGASSASSAKPTEASTETPKFGFGTTKPAIEPSKPASAAPFSFGSSAAPSSSGFSFGQKADGSAPSFSFGAAAAGKPFSFTPTFSAPMSANASSTSLASAPADGAPETATGEGDTAPPASPSKNLAEVAGAGEENEDTVLEQRGKLYRLENGKYEVVGLGVFKVKRSKDDGKRRLLLRKDGSGHVALVSRFHRLPYCARPSC